MVEFKDALERDGSLNLEKLIQPHPRQTEFLHSIYKYKRVLYGGARGGGKSYLLRWALVHFLFWCSSQGLRKVRVGLFCATYGDLWLRQIVKVNQEFPEEFGEFNEKHMEFRFLPKWGGHVIQFCNLADPTAYQSAEFAAIAIDEITLVPDLAETFSILTGSLRWTGLSWCPMFAATNPTGPSHSYVKRLWILKDFSGHEDRNKNPQHFKFIKCLPTDNPFLSDEYIKEELESLPDHLRAPWLEGSWDIVAGQRFDRLRPRVHVIDGYDTFEERRLYVESLGPTEYFESIDPGSFDPMARGIYAVTNVMQDNGEWKMRCFMMDELIERGMNYRQQAIAVRENRPANIKIAAPTYLDTQAWEEEADGLSGAQKFFQEGVPVQQVLKSRSMGFDAIDDVLHWVPLKREDGTIDHNVVVEQPVLQFFSCCSVTIQQLTDALWDPMKPRDILHPRTFRDDALDQLRYFCLTHLRAPKRKEPDNWITTQEKQYDQMMRSQKKLNGRYRMPISSLRR